LNLNFNVNINFQRAKTVAFFDPRTGRLAYPPPHPLMTLAQPRPPTMHRVYDPRNLKFNFNFNFNLHFNLWSWQRCRHGGHAHHVLDWFETHDQCGVAGCSCRCYSVDAPVYGGELAPVCGCGCMGGCAGVSVSVGRWVSVGSSVCVPGRCPAKSAAPVSQLAGRMLVC
jgi:hypothetical protein